MSKNPTQRPVPVADAINDKRLRAGPSPLRRVRSEVVGGHVVRVLVVRLEAQAGGSGDLLLQLQQTAKTK